ncbi:MAG: hypothetical protein ACRYF3_13400 [Janthinobacterium lividum]
MSHDLPLGETVSDPDVQVERPDATPATRTVHSGGYVRHSPDAKLTTWWDGLGESGRRDLAALRVGDRLSARDADRVARAGIACPAILVEENGRSVRRWLVPQALVRTILQLRLTHNERRHV